MSVSISLTVKDGHAALDFYERAFGAETTFKMEEPDGGVGHAEFKIGDSTIYLSGEFPPGHAFAMPSGSHSACSFTIVVEDCDAAWEQAVSAGAETLTEPEDQFWGMRHAMVVDPFGYRWFIGQIIEELTNEQVAERAKQLGE